MKDTHPQVKFDVFERLNTGAVKLSAQELRHGLYHGRFMKWVDKTAKQKTWHELIHAKSNKRMKAEEFLVRFLALYYEFDNYQKPLAGFLNSFSERYRDASDAQLESFENIFQRAAKGVATLFGDLAFKIFDYRHEKRVISAFNAALFDAQMLAASRVDIGSFDVARRTQLIAELGELLYDEEFQKSVARATSDEAQIKLRTKMLSDLVRKYV
jgi:hypothetical protein